jgi:hypothetical protein
LGDRKILLKFGFRCHFKPIIEEPVERLAQQTDNLVIEETTDVAQSAKQVGRRTTDI